MYSKSFWTLPLIMGVLAAMVFSGCGKKAEPVVETEQPGTKYRQVKIDDEVLAPFFDEHEFSGRWAPAKIVTPASDKTKGEYEVEFLMTTPDLEQGEKRFVKDIICKTHAASKDELKIGATIITPGDNLEDPEETKMCTWQKAVITKIGDAVIEVEFFHVYREESAGKAERYLHNIYIIDEPRS
jgi:hypothetical protein